MGNSSSSSRKRKWADYYTTASPYYWVIQFLITLYGMGAIAYLVLIQNAHVVDTVFNTLPGGTYYTWRFNSFVWFALMLSCAKILTYPFVNAAVLFRGTRGCAIFWYILLVALVLIDVVVIVGLGSQYGSCNMSNQPNNICNDPRWCCALEIYSVPSNNCFNNFACTPPVALSQLQPNTDFLFLFWTNFAIMMVDILIVLFFSIVFAFCPVYALNASALAAAVDDWSDSDNETDNGSEFAKDPPPVNTDETSDDHTALSSSKIGAPKGTPIDARAMSPTRATTTQRKK